MKHALLCLAHALLCLAIVAVQLAARHQACGRPPDKVAHSPIPPLQETLPQEATPAVRGGSSPLGIERAHETVPSAASTASSDANLRRPAAPPQQRDSASANAADPSAASKGTEQSEIWNSPKMLEARNAVMEFSRRSAQTSPAEGQQFLARLSQLPPAEMRDWLQRYQARQRNISRGQEVERMARQSKVERTIRQQEAIRDAAANVAELRSRAAEPTAAQLQWFIPPKATGPQPYGGSFSLTRSYNPFEVVIDPMSPRGYRRRAAAAASLPGDLPRSDPRNFIRGEEGIDFGEGATTRDAEPPTPPVAPVNDSTTEQ